MATKKVLINKKTRKEFHTADPEAVLKRFPKTFAIKPASKLPQDILVKEEQILKGKEDTKSETTDKKEKKDKTTPEKESK